VSQPDAFIVDAIRTPRGRGSDKGSLKSLTPVALLGGLFAALAKRRNFDTGRVTDAVIGCVTQTAEQSQNIGKLAALFAGWDDSVSGVTLNRYCASGLTATNFAAMQAINSGRLAVGGGVEMMSRVPMASDKGPLTHDFGLQKQIDLVSIGVAADAVATMEGFDRGQCDAYAATSQQRAATARTEGRFASLTPVAGADGARLLEQDETIRPGTTREGLAGLAPAFAEMGAKYGYDAVMKEKFGIATVDHVHHAGNSPATADGGSLVLVGGERAVREAGLEPRARILAMADASVDRTIALTGAADATRIALERAGLTANDIDLFEVNESFAALMLHYMKHLGIEPERLNVNGGAIALGHAMGATGGSLVGMALDELERRGAKRACVAICGAAGLATATIIERV
jgi:acetyl-CoA C-acetyltransferase